MKKVMKNKKVIAIMVVGLLAILLAATGVIASPPMGAGDPPVESKINYQGQLSDLSTGDPLDGTYTMRFQLYDDATAGTLLWDSGGQSVDVDSGLFNVKLDVDQSDFNGQGLWLEVKVEGEALGPRQEILPVPYALSLKPGARISGASTDAHLLHIDDSDTQTTYDAFVVIGETSLQAIGTGRLPLIVINAEGEALRTLGDLNVYHGDLYVEGDVDYDGALIGAFPRPAYDSGWVSISPAGCTTLTHNLGGDVDNYVVDMQFKDTAGMPWGINIHGYGGHQRFGDYVGGYWHSLTNTSIEVCRLINDSYADQIRVRIWVYK